jgi:hypothetical protein
MTPWGAACLEHDHKWTTRASMYEDAIRAAVSGVGCERYAVSALACRHTSAIMHTTTTPIPREQARTIRCRTKILLDVGSPSRLTCLVLD